MLPGITSTVPSTEGVRQSSTAQSRSEDLSTALRVGDAHASDGLLTRMPFPPASIGVSAIPSVVGTPVSSCARNNSFGSAHSAHNGDEGGIIARATRDGSVLPAEDEPKIDTKPAIIGYFGYMFGCAACGAFYSTVLSERGFSPSLIGTMMAIIPLFSLFLLPVLSFIADKYRCSKEMLAVCAVVATVTLAIFTNGSSHWVIIAGFILHVASQCPMNPLLDQQTLSMFPKKRRTEKWGFVRAFGAYGWGIGNPIASLIADRGGWGLTPIQYAVGQVALLYCICTAKPYEAVEKIPVKVKDVFHVLRANPRLLLFLVASALMGMGYSFINAFLFIFLNELGAPRFLLGLTILVTVSTEIPIFQCSKYLHRWFTDRQMMTMAMVIWAVRVFGYSLLGNPWYVLFLEPLRGITFGLMWLPGVHMVNVAFPPQLASSATGVLFTFSSGIGPVIGNLIGGLIYQAKGGAWTFRFISIFMMSAMACYQLLDRYLERRGHLLGEHSHDDHAVATTVAEAATPEAITSSKKAKDVVITGEKD